MLADESLRLLDLGAGDGETLPDPDPTPLIALLGGRTPCGTPAARAAFDLLETERLSEARRVELGRLLDRPALAAAAVVEVDGLSLLWDRSAGSRHAAGSRDADRDGLPDLIQAVEADLHHVLGRLSERLGWEPSAGPPITVVLAESAWVEGRFVRTANDRHLLLPRDLGGVERLRSAAHQLAHAALSELAPRAPSGWEEAAATFLSEAIVSEALKAEPAAGWASLPAMRDEGRAHPLRALDSPGLVACRGDAAFFAYLDGTFGLAEDWLPELWSELGARLERAAREGALLPETAERLAIESLDGLLGRAGSDLPSAVSSYFAWLLESDLLAGPPVSVDARILGLPATESRSGVELPPFSEIRFELEPPTDGGLRLILTGDGRAEAEVFALLADGELARLPMDGSVWGDRSLRLPGGRLVAVVVLVSAPTVPADLSSWGEEPAGPVPGDFQLTLEANPDYPFVLDELAGEARVGQVRIDWVTATEEDLVAWHVERARRLSGPWRRLTGVPVPPASRPGSTWSYSIVDTQVRASTRYHYRLVGVTSTGLVERSSSVSVLTLPEGPELEPEASR